MMNEIKTDLKILFIKWLRITLKNTIFGSVFSK